MRKLEAAEAIIVLFPCLSIIFVSLRCVSRYLGRNFGWDDGLMCVALVVAIGESICAFGCERPIVATIGVESGCWFPFSAWQVVNYTPKQLAVINRWSFSYQMLYHPLMGIIRLSIVVFLMRIGDVRRHIKYLLWIVFWLNIGYIISTTIANLLQCTPLEYVYNRVLMDHLIDGTYIPGGACFQGRIFVLTSCTLSIFMDLIIIPIPTLMVWRLAMPKKAKLAVVAVMSFGAIATMVSVGRFIVYYHHFSPTKTTFDYDIGHVISIAESNSAIWAGCAPALHRLVSFWFPRLFEAYGPDEYMRHRTKASRHEPTDNDDDGQQPTELTLAPRNASQKQKTSDVDAIYHLDTEFGSQEHIADEGACPGRSQSTRTGASDGCSESTAKLL